MMTSRGSGNIVPPADLRLIAPAGTRRTSISKMRSGLSQRQMTVVNPGPFGLVDSSHPQAVLSRLSEQRSHGLFCDVVIVVEDVKFRAHRNILAATSGYFRNAFRTPEIHMSSQVLELTDLKSEVFASILNFIYNAKVESSSTEDSKSLVAAGKRLGIPFLENILESETQSSSLQGQDRSNSQKFLEPSILKKETLKPEEPDCTKGPRITNAFSINEEVQNSTDASCISSSENEPTHALTEHSYAVSQGQESKENGPRNANTMPVALSAKTSARHRFGPPKKRPLLGNGLPSLLREPAVTRTTCIGSSAAEGATVTPSVSPEVHSKQVSPSDVSPPLNFDPPCISPQPSPCDPTFNCQQCPETFRDPLLLDNHTQSHKRFVSHLFCKYCHKKFMHLKRLRNHEQVCVKSLKGPSELETNNKVSLKAPILKGTLIAKPLPQSISTPDLHTSSSFDPSPLEASQAKVNGTSKHHSSSRTYKCSVCKRAYVTISSLKRHENVHSWHRAYPCHYCNKVFALAEYRTKHEIWHTGERRYQCIFCLETFLTYYILKNHQKSYHGIDPQLAVNKKAANGGFKASVYPIKLYRLLPMTFRKKRYKSYSHTYSEGNEDQDSSVSVGQLGSCSPNAEFDSTIPTNNFDVINGPSLFSMPVTFMATPKMMASETPRIIFDKPNDKPTEFPTPSEMEQPQNHRHSEFKKRKLERKRSQLFSYAFSDSAKAIKKNVGSSLTMPRPESESLTEKSTENSAGVLPFFNIPSVCSFEGLSRLSELSAAAQTIEDMASQLLQARPESITQDQPRNGKTETYIAKPACPGPSIGNQVLPLCQITVKIGNEAIVRRKIKGSKLFPKKKKRKFWQTEDIDQTVSADETMGSPSLRPGGEVKAPGANKESFHDPNDKETDKLWRPYYTYKPKKKRKKMKSKRSKTHPLRYYTRPLSPENNEDLRDPTFCPDENISADNIGVRREVRHVSQEEAFPCHSCGSSFSSQTSLSMHFLSCHRPHCRICGKQCPPEDAFGTAGSTTQESVDFLCKSCTEDGSCFSSDVTSHSLTMEKRYRCSYCPQRFLYLATKKSHEKKHLEKCGKGHSCRYCSKVCKSAVHLGLHESKHFKAEDGEDSDTMRLLPTDEDHRPLKPELWENMCSDTKPKAVDILDREYSTTTNVCKKTPLSFPYVPSKSYSSFYAEETRRASKKKLLLERSNKNGLEAHRQDPVGTLIWGKHN